MKLLAAFLVGALAGYFFAWLRLAVDPMGADRTPIERRVRALQRREASNMPGWEWHSN